MARGGRLLPTLKKQLDELPYYAAPAPKSLGFEWVHEHFLPVTGAKRNNIGGAVYLP